MTIDEAIEHAREKAKEKKRQSEIFWKYEDTLGVNNRLKNQCIACAEEHEQLAEWLEELKVLREKEKVFNLKLNNQNTAYEKGREEQLHDCHKWIKMNYRKYAGNSCVFMADDMAMYFKYNYSRVSNRGV